MSFLGLVFLTAAHFGPPPRTEAPPGALPWRTISDADAREVRYAQPRVTAQDYPTSAKAAGVEGKSVIDLTVNPDGRITHCAIVESAGLAELDAQACEIYRTRARFQLRGFTSDVRFRAPVVWQLGE